MLEAFPRLGEALCQPGWGESLMRCHFREAIGALFEELYQRGGSIDVARACELSWEAVTVLYFLEDAPEQHRMLWRKLNDRDVLHALAVLERFGALRLSEERATLTQLGSWWMGRVAGEPSEGDPVLQVKISLLGMSDPPVWRRLLLPAHIRLDRLHGVIQAAMGWEDDHMHVFMDGARRYGLADCELGQRDERKVTLGQLLKRARQRIRYTYDFGDDWEHEILLEGVLTAEPDVHYPVCVAGKGACPPEDCGGALGVCGSTRRARRPGSRAARGNARVGWVFRRLRSSPRLVSRWRRSTGRSAPAGMSRDGRRTAPRGTSEQWPSGVQRRRATVRAACR